VGKGGGSNLSWTDLALEEYRALRAEVVATMQTQGNSLSFGSATLGLVAAGAFNVWKEAFLTTVIFMFVVPFVCSLVLIIWMGEVTMMHRAGEHLLGLETELQRAFGVKPEGPVFSWESHLRSGPRRERHFGWNYAAIIWMFLSIAAGSVLLGMYRGTIDHGHQSFPLSRAAVHLAAVGMALPLSVVLAFVWWRLHIVCPRQFGVPGLRHRFGRTRLMKRPAL